MLTLFAIFAAGLLAGRLLHRRRMGFLPRLITLIVWLLLFLLGAEVGSNPRVLNGMATLGWRALVLCAGSLAGSIAAAWLFWRVVRKPARKP